MCSLCALRYSCPAFHLREERVIDSQQSMKSCCLVTDLGISNKTPLS